MNQSQLGAGGGTLQRRWSEVPWCHALRQVWREGYGLKEFRADLGAGLVVGVIALPLSMALAIASGVTPERGLYTAIVAGTLVALLGGSRMQVTGPTAAFVVILAPVSAAHGPAGLLLAGFMAGLILIAMALLRFGRLIQFIPYPVTIGFTTGIAVVIATLQIKDMLGLNIAMPESYVEKLHALFDALPQARWTDAVIGLITLGTLIAWPKVTRKVPAPLVALALATALGFAMARSVDGFEIVTLQSRFGGIPQQPPMPVLPWHLTGGNDQPFVLSFAVVRELLPAALAIAMLGAIESLLSAVVADGIAGTTHDPDGELLALGVGNVIVPFFGGIAATGALARTAANIRSGARSPISAVVQSMFVLLAVLVLAPVLAWVPMAGMAALLLMVAWNMSEIRHFLQTLRIAPKSDSAVQLVCFGLTVIFDMVIAVGAGIVLAAVLFMRRMAEVADVRLVAEEHHHATFLPPGVAVYEIAGPLFFGAAHKATQVLQTMGKDVRVVVLDLRSVPVMDGTALVNLQSAVARLAKRGIHVVLAGVQKQPLTVLAKAHLKHHHENMTVRGNFEEGIARAAALAITLT